MRLQCRLFLSVLFLQIQPSLGKDGDDDDDSGDKHGHGKDGDSSSTSSSSSSSSSSSPSTPTTNAVTINTPPPNTVTRTATSTTTSTSQVPFSSSSHPSAQTSGSSKPTQTAITDTTLMIHFAPPPNISTCDSTTFFWTPVGPSNNISLVVTNNGASNNSVTETISTTLTKSVSTNTQLFTWFDVDVTQGWYLIQAELAAQPNTVLAKSAPFFVENGTDTSCVRPHTQPSPSPSPTPNQSSQDRSHVSSAQIIGLVIAAIAACVILSVAFLFPRWWRRALPSNRKRRLLY